jgi:crossover junction endodeoxyribonuclease RuvC
MAGMVSICGAGINSYFRFHHLATKLLFPLQSRTRIILGIDPGTVVMGYGIIEVNGKNLRLLEMDSLRLSTKKDVYERLRIIHETVTELIEQHKPSEFAIEAPFFGKNVQSMLKLGRAQGVAIAVAMRAGLTVTEYSPKKVKQAITGNGNANKDQVWSMLQRILNPKHTPSSYDATDAVAVALCHYYQDNPLTKIANSRTKGWEDFLKKKPDRIAKK